jgi:hypothetical protein
MSAAKFDIETFRAEFFSRLHSRIHENGLTFDSFAPLVKKPAGTLRNYKNTACLPDIDLCARMALALKTSPAVLAYDVCKIPRILPDSACVLPFAVVVYGCGAHEAHRRERKKK